MSIIVDKISHVYEAGTGFERKALDNVSFAIEDGEFIGLIAVSYTHLTLPTT